MCMSFQTLYFWGNIVVGSIGLFVAISAFIHYRKLNQTGRAIRWFIGSLTVCLIFVNGIIKVVEIMDEHMRKEAFELLDESFKERGDPNNESYDNLELVVTPDKNRSSTSYNIYVANFNKQYSYKGKIKITIRNKRDKKVFTHVMETITIKPGEKKEIENVNYDTWHPNYSWRWLGELKK